MCVYGHKDLFTSLAPNGHQHPPALFSLFTARGCPAPKARSSSSPSSRPPSWSSAPPPPPCRRRSWSRRPRTASRSRGVPAGSDPARVPRCRSSSRWCRSTRRALLRTAGTTPCPCGTRSARNRQFELFFFLGGVGGGFTHAVACAGAFVVRLVRDVRGRAHRDGRHDGVAVLGCERRRLGRDVGRRPAQHVADHLGALRVAEQRDLGGWAGGEVGLDELGQGERALVLRVGVVLDVVDAGWVDDALEVGAGLLGC